MARVAYRLYVLQRITELLQGITDVAGLTVDMTDKIHRGRTTFGDSDDMPCISILESTRPDIGIYAGYNDEMRDSRLQLVVQGWVENDVENPSDPAYELQAAVEKRLGLVIATGSQGEPADEDWYMLGAMPPGNEDRRSARLVAAFGFTPGVVSPPRDQVSTQAFFFLPVWVKLAERIGQPYIAV